MVASQRRRSSRSLASRSSRCLRETGERERLGVRSLRDLSSLSLDRRRGFLSSTGVRSRSPRSRSIRLRGSGERDMTGVRSLSLSDFTSLSVERRRVLSRAGKRSSRCLRSRSRDRCRRECRLDLSLLSSRRREDFCSLLLYLSTARATSSFFSSIKNSFIGSSSSWSWIKA